MVRHLHPLTQAPIRFLVAGVIALVCLTSARPGVVRAQDGPDESDIVSPAATDIVGGDDADPGEWPWQVAVEFAAGGLDCGGSIVQPRWVLTAAHCVGEFSGWDPANLRIKLGDHDRSVMEGTEQVRSIVQIVVHPGRDTSIHDTDIALLKLALPATINERVQLIPLVQSPVDDGLVEAGDIASLTGWGVLSFGGASPSILQEVEVPIVSNSVCEAAYTGLNPITENMLCAGYVEGGRDSCQGDSGGPLVVPDGAGGWKQAGIVSFADGCALPGKYGVNARVSRFVDWIDEYTKTANGPVSVRNGDFELGQNGDWIEDSFNGYSLVTNSGLTETVTPRSGEYVAWLGGGEGEASRLSQIVSLHDRASTLQFYYQVRSGEPTCDASNQGSVSIGGIELDSVALCVANHTSDWTLAEHDISPYAGRTVALHFRANTITPTSYLIDDVSILLTPGSALDVTGFAPSSGKPGTAIAVTGSNFADLTEVLVGGVPVPYAVQSDSSFSFTVPLNGLSGVIEVKTAYSTTGSLDPFTVLHPLTVAKDGGGAGSVTASGIDCGSDCGEDVAQGVVVALAAEADADSVFDGWSGACADSSPTCEVTMDGAKVVTATFALKTFGLNVGRTGDGAGSVSSAPSGIACGGDCSATYDVHTSVTLTATPAANSDFTDWGGDCSGAASPCSVTIDAAKHVTAAFTLKDFGVTVSKNGDGAGSVASTPAGIECGQDCTESYKTGTSLTLTAQPAVGTLFSGWTGACSGENPVCTFAVEQEAVVSATFTLQLFALTVITDGEGSGRVVSTPGAIDCGAVCEQPFAFGTSVALVAEPDEGSTFVGWGGACSGEDMACVVDVAEAASATATFAVEEPPGSTLYLPSAINN